MPLDNVTREMTPENFRPMGARVLVKMLEAESTSPSGDLFIPETAQRRSMLGRVISVGPGRQQKDGTTRPLEVQTGDVCMFSRYTGTDVILNGEEYLILHADEVVGIVEDPDAIRVQDTLQCS